MTASASFLETSAARATALISSALFMGNPPIIICDGSTFIL
ncbi:hypothetical protein EVA_16886 [gut metagenome]|uniref:Secreted protein n=1 Tax=gut metagenome TaxID=749906 RepID=J9FZM8_9ZZZZ